MGVFCRLQVDKKFNIVHFISTRSTRALPLGAHFIVYKAILIIQQISESFFVSHTHVTCLQLNIVE